MSEVQRGVLPYRIWSLAAPFTKKGFPVIGSFGATVRQVVIFEAETFKRLISEHPSLAHAQFEIGEMVDDASTARSETMIGEGGER